MVSLLDRPVDSCAEAGQLLRVSTGASQRWIDDYVRDPVGLHAEQAS